MLSLLPVLQDELSGADIKAVCTEAGLLALRERRMRVTQVRKRAHAALGVCNGCQLGGVLRRSHADPRLFFCGLFPCS